MDTRSVGGGTESTFSITWRDGDGAHVAVPLDVARQAPMLRNMFDDLRDAAAPVANIAVSSREWPASARDVMLNHLRHLSDGATATATEDSDARRRTVAARLLAATYPLENDGDVDVVRETQLVPLLDLSAAASYLGLDELVAATQDVVARHLAAHRDPKYIRRLFALPNDLTPLEEEQLLREAAFTLPQNGGGDDDDGAEDEHGRHLLEQLDDGDDVAAFAPP